MTAKLGTSGWCRLQIGDRLIPEFSASKDDQQLPVNRERPKDLMVVLPDGLAMLEC